MKKCSTYHLKATVKFALSLTIYEISANKENCQNPDLENEGQGQEVEKLDLRHELELLKTI